MNYSQSKPRSQFKLYLLEFSVILFNFSSFLPSILLLNQLLKQACIQFGYERLVCDVISQNDDSTIAIEHELQPYVAQIFLVITLIHSSIPAVLQLFLGPWSDRHGRKGVMNFAAIGFISTHTSAAAVCYYSEHIHPLSPWLYVLCYLPVNLLGGFSAILTATLCYITDTCEESKRSYHFTLIEVMNVFSLLSGTLACSFILSVSNATAVFITAAVCAIIGAVIVIAFIDESVESSSKLSSGSILSTVHIKDMLKTCFKPRVLYDRWILLSLIFIMMLNRFALDWSINVGYLFERVQFNWTLDDHNYYQAASIVMTVVGVGLSMLVFKGLLGASEMALITLAIYSNLIDNFLRVFASQSWQMFAISSITFMKIVVHPLCRSLISSIVASDEVGKVMSFTTSFEAIANCIAPPIFVAVYEATYTTFPGAFFLVAASVCLINIFMAFAVTILQKVSGQIRVEYDEVK